MKKFGFTLAEVLITLGILGVITSLTLPALKNEIDKSSWATGLSTNVSNLNRGFAQMIAESNGTDSLDSTALWGDIIVGDKWDKKKDEIKKELAKYFKIEKMSDGVSSPVFTMDHSASTDLDSTMRFELANGASMYVEFNVAPNVSDCSTYENNGGSLCEKMAEVYIDVNGNKKPNTFGKDIYFFYLGNDGKLYPYGGNDVHVYNSSAPLWNSTTGCNGDTRKDEWDEKTCTARVIEDGYKINYKY